MTLKIARIVGLLAAIVAGIAVMVHPDGGLIYANPVVPLAVGLIGLGLIKQARGATHPSVTNEAMARKGK